MAYRNLVAQSCADHGEAFKRVRDFLCARNGSYDYSTTGIGWTLHDAVYAVDQNTPKYADYFVVYSASEDGGQDMYYKISYVSAGISVQGYLYWNNSTHAGVNGFGNNTSPNWTHVNSTSLTLWIYGSLDGFTLVDKYTSTYYAVFAGHFPDAPMSQTPVSSTSSVTAGSSKVVSFSSVPASWVTGKRLVVRNNADIERVQISSVAGTDVTFASFAAGYASGAKFSEELTYCTNYNNNFAGSMSFAIDHTGAKGGYVGVMATAPGSMTAADDLTATVSAIKRWHSTTSTMIGPFPDLLLTMALTAESTHSDGVNTWRFFGVNSSCNMLLRES